jgi:hypothetical protein
MNLQSYVQAIQYRKKIQSISPVGIGFSALQRYCSNGALPESGMTLDLCIKEIFIYCILDIASFVDMGNRRGVIQNTAVDVQKIQYLVH